MTIEFMFNNIKTIELIYLTEEIYDEDFGDNIKEEKYLGTSYCENIMNEVQAHFPEHISRTDGADSSRRIRN